MVKTCGLDGPHQFILIINIRNKEFILKKIINILAWKIIIIYIKGRNVNRN